MVDNPYKYPYVPVGGVIEWDGTGLTGAPDLSTPEKVAAVYGYGTWERYGTDRVTVGAGGEYEAGAVGGEKGHALTKDEGPKHSHEVANNASANGTEVWAWRAKVTENTGASGGKYTLVGTTESGMGAPHNNMQPYIATYRYRRIA